MAKKTGKDLFHGQGNQTVALPSKVKSSKKVFTDPEGHNPGNLLKTKKSVRKGWNK